MKKIVFVLFCMLACLANVNAQQVAQQVTKTAHKKGVKTDVVTTGSMTIRKPNYICISTDNDRDQLIMDGTKFTMTMGGKTIVVRILSSLLSRLFWRLLSTVAKYLQVKT